MISALTLSAASLLAQSAPPQLAREEPQDEWEFATSVFYSDPPGSEDRLTPILYADRGPLHLEARYNYEDLETLSVFAGWTFETGEEVAVSFTPMLGAVVGDTDGIAPALEFDLGWERLEWYAEMEYVIDIDESDDNFFYSWSTLMYGLTDAFSAGVVIERSKLVDTDFDVQRGLALQFAHENFGISLYAYNLGESDDSYAVVSFEFAP